MALGIDHVNPTRIDLRDVDLVLDGRFLEHSRNLGPDPAGGLFSPALEKKGNPRHLQ